MADETVTNPAPPPSPAAPPASAAPTPPPVAGAPDGGGTKSLAEGGGGDDKPQVVPATWPDTWREILSAGDQKFLQRLTRFNSPGNFAKSWLAAQQKISSGELIKAKPDGKNEEALNEWRAEAGIPAKPEGYLENVPNGLVIGENDKPLVGAFLADMHTADAPPEFVHKALSWYYANQEKMLEERFNGDRTHRQQGEDELRAEWGPEYRPNLNGVHALFKTHAPAGLLEEFFSARMANGTLLGDHPGVLKFFAAVSREVNPHGTVTPIEGKTQIETIATEKEALRKEMADNRSDYWKNETKQARWRELDEMEQRHKQRAG